VAEPRKIPVILSPEEVARFLEKRFIAGTPIKNPTPTKQLFHRLGFDRKPYLSVLT
jgi:hypothetical protein